MSQTWQNLEKKRITDHYFPPPLKMWDRKIITFHLEKFLLTLSWPGKFLFHPKIRCFNFKPQYLLNYSSPINDLYSVQKRSIGAFKSIFKLLGWGPAGAGPLRTMFFARSSPLACGFAALAPNFARVVSLLAFQHVSKHAGGALTQC